ncbi:putative enzyme [Candidatus Terasakiella magnetica]|uniref:Zinc metalloprotease n=1 Tax=Candidatus Terasakiella magnetica TaxID=1867952 RepID=A0A1C3RCL9_9PROT|nr:RIP metalloprotease RseP [Candidatus Terasakiella magnetica]SCA55027.1 putative enzyme [Candidatus Terasakiella magnetica]
MYDILFANPIVAFIFALSVLVFFHELGHYWVARRNGVKVEIFSIGFGPELFGWNDKSDTRWKVCLMPFGGYVKMFGDTDAASSGSTESEERPFSDEEMKVSFYYKSLGARAAIVAAGPIANFILAAVLFALLYMAVGVPEKFHAGVGEVVAESAAAEAGLEKGDLILSLGGQKLDTFDDLREIVMASPNKALDAIVLRNGSELAIKVTPKAREAGDKMVGQLGIRPDAEQAEYVRYNPVVAVWMGIERTYDLSAQILSHLGTLITGGGSMKDLGGPLRIAQVSGDAAKSGFDSLIYLMAVLSVNLGLINLFPIPMLDGGHLVFYAAEAIRGKPLSERAQEYGFRFGLTLVLGLMVFATWNDLVQLKVFDFITQLFT